MSFILLLISFLCFAIPSFVTGKDFLVNPTRTELIIGIIAIVLFVSGVVSAILQIKKEKLRRKLNEDA